MRGVIAGVPMIDMRPNRHCPIGGRGQDEQQLLEVGTMILVRAVGDPVRRAPPHRHPIGRRILSGERHRRRVVMQFLQIKI
jgi:hypothetical protein